MIPPTVETSAETDIIPGDSTSAGEQDEDVLLSAFIRETLEVKDPIWKNQQHPTTNATSFTPHSPAYTNYVTEKQESVSSFRTYIMCRNLNPDKSMCPICKQHLVVIWDQLFEGFRESRVCPLVLGKCGHVFHQHCMEHWLKQRRECPVDSKRWVENPLLSYETAREFRLIDCRETFRTSRDEASSEDHTTASNHVDNVTSRDVENASSPEAESNSQSEVKRDSCCGREAGSPSQDAANSTSED